jgi:hypothetical protein
LLCSCLVFLLGTIPRYSRSDPTPNGPTAMPSLPPFASPSPMHCTLRLLPTDIGCGTLAPRSRLLPTGIGCGTLASRSRRDTATQLLATQTAAVATTTCLGCTRIPKRCARPRPHRCTSAPTSNGYWVCHPRPSHSPRHGNTHCSRLKPRHTTRPMSTWVPSSGRRAESGGPRACTNWTDPSSFPLAPRRPEGATPGVR